MIGHHARFRENDDLALWQGPATKKKPPFCNARALITRKIMRSRDAQCNTNLLLTEREGRTGEYWPEVVAVRTERIQNDRGPIFPGTARAS